MGPHSSHHRGILYLGGDSASKQYGIAEIQGRGVGEDAQPVPSMGRHPKGAVPLVQCEEKRGEVQRDKNSHPHGPVERPHEGSDGGCSVSAANLVEQKKLDLSSSLLPTRVTFVQNLLLCNLQFVGSYQYFSNPPRNDLFFFFLKKGIFLSGWRVQVFLDDSVN